MTWLQRMLSLVGMKPKAAASQGTAALTPLSPELIKWFGQPTAAGKSVTEESAMRVAAVWACRRILAESIGSLPWSMHKHTSDRNSEQDPNHWLHAVLVGSPNRDMTDVEFRESIAHDLTGDGNAYSLIDTLGKRVTSLYPMPACDVTPMRKLDNNTKLSLQNGEVFFRFNERNKPVDYPREKVWHIKGFGSGLKGLSPITAAREGIGGALAMEEFSNRFFAQGGMPAGTITLPGWLTPEQRDVARDSLQRLIGGLGKAHQFAMFEGGMKPEAWNATNMEDMQFILGRKFSVLEICRIFRVPPHMVAELEKGASYASIEQMSMDFVQHTLMPYLTRIERSASKWLLPPEERLKVFLRFNVDAYLRADSKGRAEFLSTMVNNGMMTRNEARAKENLNKSTEKNMDAFTVQTAMIPIEKLGEQPKEKPGAPGFPKRREEDDDAVPPKKEASHSTTVQAAIVLPEKMNHDVHHSVEVTDMREIAVKFANGQAALASRFDAGLREILAAVTSQQVELLGAVASGQERMISAVATGQERLLGAVESGNEAVAEKLGDLAKQSREIITEDGERFVSKPLTH